MTGVSRESGFTRDLFRWLLAIIYLVAGIAHIRSPGGFLAITPEWVPFPAEVILFTGIAEIAGAVGLMIGGTTASWLYHAPRLAFQPVFIWWALISGGVINWPFRRN